ncbi:MAG: hypothetical protein ACKOTB_18910, partial [Planctomycetia bacterium]
WFVETIGQLYGLSILLALVLGGIQSLLRAVVAGRRKRLSVGMGTGFLVASASIRRFGIP